MSRTADIQAIFQKKEKEKEKRNTSLIDAKDLLKGLKESKQLKNPNSDEKKNEERAGYFQSLGERLMYKDNLRDFFAEEAGREVVKDLWKTKIGKMTFHEKIVDLYEDYLDLGEKGKDESPQKTAKIVMQQTFYLLASYIRIQNKLKESEAE